MPGKWDCQRTSEYFSRSEKKVSFGVKPALIKICNESQDNSSLSFITRLLNDKGSMGWCFQKLHL